MRLVVLSDDFTGALDTGVQFARTGVSTVVTTPRADGSLPAAQGCTVLVVDTESRHLTAEAAGARVRDTVLRIRHGVGGDAQAEPPGDPRLLWYKKTDSLLRGNIGSELAALMDAAGGGELAFVPAFPATGRTTTGGVQYLDGVPIDRTPFAPDQLNPIRSARVEEIIGFTAPGVRTRTITRDQARRAGGSVIDERTVPTAPPPAARSRLIRVYDAETDDDLRRIAIHLARWGRLRLTAGCAGFASSLAEAANLPRGRPERADLQGPLFALCGSMTELSRRQAAFAAESGFAVRALDTEEKLRPGFFASPSGRRIARDLAAVLSEGRPCILSTREASRADEARRAESLGLAPDRIPAVIAENLAGIARELYGLFAVKTLVVFGGDTTMALLSALDVHTLVPLQELLPGVPVSRMGNGIHLVTKSGGFGDPDVLPRIARMGKKKNL